VQSLAVGQNEVTACKLLYPSHFLTPEGAHAQHSAAQQQILAVMEVIFLTEPRYHTWSRFNKGGRDGTKVIQEPELKVQIGVRAIDQAQCEQGNENLPYGSDSERAPSLLAEFPQAGAKTYSCKGQQERPAG